MDSDCEINYAYNYYTRCSCFCQRLRTNRRYDALNVKKLPVFNKKAGIDNALKACQTPAWETYFRVCTKSLFNFSVMQ